MSTELPYETYIYNNQRYVSLMSLYHSDLFPTFFAPLRKGDITPNHETLRKLLDVYNIPFDKYILVFRKDVLAGEPYITYGYLQTLLFLESTT